MTTDWRRSATTLGSPGPACHGGGMDAFRLVATVVVMVGVVVAILLFERRRAEGIRRDTGRMAQGRRPEGDADDEDGRAG